VIGKAGTQRPGTIRELFDKRGKIIDHRDAKHTLVVNHPSSLSKDKKMPPRRDNAL
jgi:hypothetical protein